MIHQESTTHYLSPVKTMIHPHFLSEWLGKTKKFSYNGLKKRFAKRFEATTPDEGGTTWQLR
jgi:hypothetical protein